ncbi:MAG: sigma-54 dependent transcriptional regulator [Acidobacteriota bacterium]|nr:sigma-54 dependent transcriptional regulator [Acidobacteriota bacterium]
MTRILIVDDEEFVRWPLKRRLEKEGFEVFEAGNCRQGMSVLVQQEIHLAVLDLKLPDGDGVSLLGDIRKKFPDLPVIMMTAFGSVETAVEALKLGAFDYIAKPCNLEELILLVNKALEMTSLREEVKNLRSKVSGRPGFETVVGSSPRLRHVIDQAKIVSETDSTNVLILGESGTGKNLLAEAIHNRGPRAGKPFITVTCTAMPGELIESELFGHEKGAFTDAKTAKKGLCEVADGGTLFLDEIGDIPLSLQAKLLGFLENHTFRRIGGTRDLKVDVRIIAATNKNLKQEVRAKNFREDLFYRLNVSSIEMPPLRDRADDIPLLVMRFIGDLNLKLRKNIKGVSEQALNAMMRYPWPGNIRELKNMLERSIIFARGEELGRRDFPLDLFFGPEEGDEEPVMILPPEGIDFEKLERSLVKQALERTGGNQAKAGRLLNFTRDQMRYRVKQFGLTAADTEN